MEAASLDSLLGDEEAVSRNSQPRSNNGASVYQPMQAQPPRIAQPVHRMPLVIRRLPPPPPNLSIPDDPEHFTFKFLLSSLRGHFRPPGCYNVTNQTPLQVYPVKSWYAIDSDEEPFMPTRPGQHGAKLTLLVPEEPEGDDYSPKEACPFFVKRGSRGYVYYGTYRQPRYSDRLSYAEMELEVPRSVKEHRAKEVGRKDKPKWIVEALKCERVVATDEEAQAFGTGDILEAFQRVCEKPLRPFCVIYTGLINCGQADTDLGLRLYWEYFECVGYDRKLYDALVERKRSSE